VELAHSRRQSGASTGDEPTVVVLAAVAANLAVAAVKFVAATVTGSAALAAEGVQKDQWKI